MENGIITKLEQFRRAHPYIQVLQRGGIFYLFSLGKWYYFDARQHPLGAGAMGTVYLGYSLDDDSKVAIKKINDEISKVPSVRERARLEAALAFHHPNIVEMLGCCEIAGDGGQIFILSRFVDGITLEDHVKQLNGNPNKIEIICREMCCVLQALGYLHSRGIVHRDIKPSNIMIENDSIIKLMDLGIAHLNGDNHLTMAGFIGTTEYAAPEQILRCEDSSLEIDATSDIYALGITIYVMITGDNPFSASTDFDTRSNQLKNKLPYNSMIPQRLMKVLWKATEKQQRDRYQSADEFKNAIEDALAPPKSFWAKLSGNETILLIIGLGIVAIIVIIFLLLNT